MSSASAAFHAAPARAHVLRLYRRLLQQGGTFKDYNLRETARRKVRERFRAHRSVDDVVRVSALYSRALDDLSTLQRSVTVHNMYHQQPYVIEQQSGSGGSKQQRQRQQSSGSAPPVGDAAQQQR